MAETHSDHLDTLHRLLQKHPEGLSITQITRAVGINRNSVARYMDVLESEGRARARPIGPAKLYTASRDLPKNIQIDLFKRAMDQASCGITIADANAPDMPLVYVNAEFLRMTGYDEHDVLNKNCRFLQGPESDKGALQKIRRALRSNKPVEVTLINYRKDGSQFKNNLRLSPVRDKDGKITHYIGIQTKV